MEMCGKCEQLHFNRNEDDVDQFDCRKLERIECIAKNTIKVEYGDLRDWFFEDGIDPNSDSDIDTFKFHLVFADDTILEIDKKRMHVDVHTIETRIRIQESNKQVIGYYFTFGPKTTYFARLKGSKITSFPITLVYTIVMRSLSNPFAYGGN